MERRWKMMHYPLNISLYRSAVTLEVHVTVSNVVC
jgi:hypothetical protein